MLNLNCVICAELFGQTDDVHVTLCGHMFHFMCLTQWLERSKTCPQCRTKCSERNIFRLYFNLANLDTSRVDICSLQEQLDNAKLEVQLKNKEIEKAEAQVKTLKESQKKCMKTITGLEEELQKKDFTVLSYVEQLKMLKNEAKVAGDLRKEVRSLRQQIEAMDDIASILKGSNADAEKLLSTEKDPKKLGAWVVTLKRELRHSENKKTDLRTVLRVVQNDLRRETDLKKTLEERVSQLESENYQLNEKLKALERPVPGTSKIKQVGLEVKAETNFNNMLLETLKEANKRISISPTIQDNMRKIEESDSPYLNIKSSSVGLMPYPFKRQFNTMQSGKDTTGTAHTTTKLATLKISPRKPVSNGDSLMRKTSSDLIEKYSIFKKPRLVLPSRSAIGGRGAATATTAASSTAMKPLPSNLVFNGFGGSERIDPFAKPNPEDVDVVEIVDDKTAKSSTRKPAKQNSAHAAIVGRSVATTGADSTVKKPVASNLLFNGFGGSERVNPLLKPNPEDDDVIEIVDDKTTKSSTLSLAKQKTATALSEADSNTKKMNLKERVSSKKLRDFMYNI